MAATLSLLSPLRKSVLKAVAQGQIVSDDTVWSLKIRNPSKN